MLLHRTLKENITTPTYHQSQYINKILPSNCRLQESSGHVNVIQCRTVVEQVYIFSWMTRKEHDRLRGHRVYLNGKHVTAIQENNIDFINVCHDSQLLPQSYLGVFSPYTQTQDVRVLIMPAMWTMGGCVRWQTTLPILTLVWSSIVMCEVSVLQEMAGFGTGKLTQFAKVESPSYK